MSEYDPIDPQIHEDELSVMAHLAHAYNEFAKLPVQHNADLADFTFAIHAAQNIVLARVGLRQTKIYRPEPVIKEHYDEPTTSS